MGALFDPPTPPPVPPPPPNPPTVANASTQMAGQAARQRARQAAGGMGFAGTVQTSPQGLNDPVTNVAKSMLGS